ncbi:hypothetical protein B4110_2060 [Parageobacillus toebii]|uniref:Uncharacterized protein n=1 Tax=Parageobacillus toebii TaxID=153151 RepID=A0A150MF85_9BACL|nr:hypothetical protein B4110_2060 [Parageobacillus toebii]
MFLHHFDIFTFSKDLLLILLHVLLFIVSTVTAYFFQLWVA